MSEQDNHTPLPELNGLPTATGGRDTMEGEHVPPADEKAETVHANGGGAGDESAVVGVEDEKADEGSGEHVKVPTAAEVEDETDAVFGNEGDEVVLEYAKSSRLKRPKLKTFFTFYGILLVILPIVFLAMIAFLLKKPLTVLIIGCVTLIPASFCFLLIKYYLHDDVVPTSFLMDQIFIGAVPAVVIASVAIFLILGIIVRWGFSTSIFFQFGLMFRQISKLARTTNPRERMIWLDRYRNSSIFHVVVLGPLVYGAVASVIQEFAKLSVAFRCEQVLHFGPALGPRGAVATATAAGLGFATMKIMCFSLILVGQNISLGKVAGTLLLSLWMLPLHIGTAFLMGVAIAKKKILHMKASLFGAYLTTVIFSFLVITGNMYLTGIIYYRSFFVSKTFSGWIFAAGITGKVVLISLLIVLCVRSYRTMDLERYHEMPGYEIGETESESCQV